MNDLTPDDRALLDLARGGNDPTASDRSRVERALVARLGAATIGLTATTLASKTAAATASIGGAALAKIVTVAAVVIGVGGTVIYQARASSEESSRATRATVASAAPPLPRPLAPPATRQERIEKARPEAPAPEAIAAPPRARVRAAPQASGASPSTLNDETGLLAEADFALRSGNGARALAILEQHKRMFPRSALEEERAVERILALCASGRSSEARAAADSFSATHPQSPYAPRVRAGCARERGTDTR